MEIELYEHPEYKAKVEDWIRYRDLYEGNRKVLKSFAYLVPHMFEISDGRKDGSKLRSVRESLTVYRNRIEPIVSRWVSTLFKSDPVLDDQVVELFSLAGEEQPVSEAQEKFSTFFKDKVARDYFLYGKACVVVDSLAIKPQNAAQELLLKNKPFFRVISPIALKDWQGEGIKGLTEARYEYYQVEPRASLQEKPTENLYTAHYRLIGDKVIITIYQADPKSIKEGNIKWEAKEPIELQNSFSALPIQVLQAEESWIKDIAEVSLALYNKESSRDNIEHYQSYQRIFITGISDSQHKEMISEYSIGFLPDNSNVISLQPVDTTSQQNTINDDKNELTKIAMNTLRQPNADSKMIEAADSQQESKEEGVKLLLSIIEQLEAYANRLVLGYAEYLGKKNFKGKVTLNKDIRTTDIDRLIQSYSLLKPEIDQVPVWRKSILRKVAESQKLEKQEEILEQIETAATPAQENEVVANPIISLRQRLNGITN